VCSALAVHLLVDDPPHRSGWSEPAGSSGRHPCLRTRRGPLTRWLRLIYNAADEATAATGSSEPMSRSEGFKSGWMLVVHRSGGGLVRRAGGLVSCGSEGHSHSRADAQAVESGGWIYVSALFGPDPKTGRSRDDPSGEAERMFANLDVTAAESGLPTWSRLGLHGAPAAGDRPIFNEASPVASENPGPTTWWDRVWSRSCTRASPAGASRTPCLMLAVRDITENYSAPGNGAAQATIRPAHLCTPHGPRIDRYTGLPRQRAGSFRCAARNVGELGRSIARQVRILATALHRHRSQLPQCPKLSRQRKANPRSRERNGTADVARPGGR
jgi:hypothetical protein